jgi:hypothetical protein
MRRRYPTGPRPTPVVDARLAAKSAVALVRLQPYRDDNDVGGGLPGCHVCWSIGVGVSRLVSGMA